MKSQHFIVNTLNKHKQIVTDFKSYNQTEIDSNQVINFI